ncbi:MAG TPA: hypothetical protein PKD73_12270 [Burkholderiaceae bacterium]|nr:hypothetical protein [Burkholderiaceae bacterium]
MVVLLVRSRPRLFEPVVLAVVEDGLVHERAVVVSVYAEHREGQIGRGDRHGFDDKGLVAHRHGDALRPAAGNVGQHQSVDEVAVGLCAAAVFDQVDLEEARRWVAPIRERAHGNAAANGRADARPPLALPIDAIARVAQGTVDGRGADLQELGLDHRVQLKVAVSLHRVDQDRDQNLQPLSADTVACLPQHNEGLAHGFVVEPIA